LANYYLFDGGRLVANGGGKGGTLFWKD